MITTMKPDQNPVNQIDIMQNKNYLKTSQSEDYNKHGEK
jgi:hypothetical protein